MIRRMRRFLGFIVKAYSILSLLDDGEHARSGTYMADIG